MDTRPGTRVRSTSLGRIGKADERGLAAGHGPAWSWSERLQTPAPLQAETADFITPSVERGRGSKVRCLTHAREELLQSCIREFYLKPERPSVAALAQKVKRRFSEQGFPSPHYRTIGRRIEALDLRFVMRKREGAKRAREKFGPVGVSTLGADSPMDVLQIDHTLEDVIVVDREQRLPIGRPWLTLAIDIATRAVIGFNVSLETPSALSISLVLSHAVMPKAAWLADRELHNLDWPMAGLPRLVHVDNAKEFHSEALLRGCQEY